MTTQSLTDTRDRARAAVLSILGCIGAMVFVAVAGLALVAWTAYSALQIAMAG
ncbi:hypothetical protein AB0N73_05825 [Microbacterium sp. NPDC089189]|uniref:hypothetical protein n=1 Tax=Microbacterium sp. NPDC089189 TaxID=3154972 RepID=UPI0034458DC4